MTRRPRTYEVEVGANTKGDPPAPDVLRELAAQLPEDAAGWFAVTLVHDVTCLCSRNRRGEPHARLRDCTCPTILARFVEYIPPGQVDTSADNEKCPPRTTEGTT